MKKIIYVILFAMIVSLTITSCTEESVKPKTNTGNGGGSDPLK